jgi:hypothetical protein
MHPLILDGKWDEFLDIYLRPSVEWGSPGAVIHNPGGSSNSIYDWHGLNILDNAFDADIIKNLADALDPYISEGIDLWVYLGSPRDEDLVLDSAAILNSIMPILDLGVNIAFDMSSMVERNHWFADLAYFLKKTGREVGLEPTCEQEEKHYIDNDFDFFVLERFVRNHRSDLRWIQPELHPKPVFTFLDSGSVGDAQQRRHPNAWAKACYAIHKRGDIPVMVRPQRMPKYPFLLQEPRQKPTVMYRNETPTE